VQFVHLTALELSYTPEPCNIFVKVRPVFQYLLCYSIMCMCIPFTFTCILKIPVILVFCCFFSDNFVGILFPCS